VEELRMHQKYDAFMKIQKKKKSLQPNTTPNISVLTANILESALNKV
jgi:hypothetical protein